MTERTWKALLAAGWQLEEGEPDADASAQLVAHAAEAMRRRFGADRKRVCHALRVLRLTDELLEAAEPLAPGQALGARLCAVLHDIGIQQAERLHGSAAARFQELEGPPIASDILQALSVTPALTERVCHIVGRHHTATAVDGPDFQLLWEADLLVNLMEDGARDSAALRGALERNLLSTGAWDVARQALPFLNGPLAVDL